MARAAALVLVTFAAYVPALRAGYIHWDDPEYVVHNPDLRDAEGLAGIWTSPGTPRQYYPLVFTSFWVEHHLWGNWAGGYHAVNVALHAANAVLLWLLLVRLGIPGALLAAAVFAVHPVHVESVAWIAERKNVLSGLFYLLSALAYVRFALPKDGDSSPSRPRRWYALAIVAFACALLSKTATCTLPVALLIVLWWKRSRLGWRDVLPLIPMLAMAAAAGMLTGWIEKHYDVGENVAIPITLAQRFGLAGTAVWFYAGKLLLPYPLIPIYSHWEITGWFLVPGFALVAVAAWLWLLRKRIGKWPVAALAIFVAGHGPTLGFVDFAYMFSAWVGDRFQYLPSMAFLAAACAIAAGLAQRIGGRAAAGTPQSDPQGLPEGPSSATARHPFFARRAGVAGWAAGLLVVGVLAAMTWNQSSIYRGTRTFFEYVVSRNPQSTDAENSLGAALEEQGNLDQAAAHFRRAIALSPRSALAYLNLGATLRRLNEFDEAARMLTLSAKLAPRRGEPHYQLGLLLSRKGDWPGAIEELRLALRLDETIAGAWDGLGAALLKIGKVPEAVSACRQAVRLDLDSADYRVTLGDALAADNKSVEAARQYQSALQIDPACADAHFGLAMLAFRARRESQAVASFRLAIRHRPDWPEAMSNLAMLLATAKNPALRNPAQAVALASQAVAKADQPSPFYLSSLAAAYASAGQFPQAIDTVTKAIDLARAAGNEGLAGTLARQLTLYQAGKPLVPLEGGATAGQAPRPSTSP
jgi:tetratricopeptide (TPR) repeat protein